MQYQVIIGYLNYYCYNIYVMQTCLGIDLIVIVLMLYES